MGKTQNTMKVDKLPCPRCGGPVMNNYKHDPHYHKCLNLKCHIVFFDLAGYQKDGWSIRSPSIPIKR